MNYYEEWGIDKSATAGEIRQAYRHLARLVHPDLQFDDEPRRAAEAQMKRLNMISQVLTDPSRRREYDRALLPLADLVRNSRPPVPTDRAGAFLAWLGRVDRTLWVWAGASLVGLASIAAFYGSNEAPRPVSAMACPQPLPVPVPFIHPPARPEPSAAAGTSQKLLKPLPPIVPGSPQSAPDELPPEPEISLGPADTAPAPAFAAVALTGSRSLATLTFAGNWIYLPGAGSPSTADRATKGYYAPESIEIKIAQQNGQVWGIYRARYRVTDPGIPPVVVFQFEGRSLPPQATIAWTGAGGARGVVNLKLVAEDKLDVTWTATRLSKEFALVSGVATVVRQRAP